jgi:cobalt-zinc-cadmium resistance protein CzcA
LVERLIRFSLHNRLLVSLAAIALLGGGLYSLRSLKVDAFPDVTPVLVQVLTESAGMAPEEIEQLVTYPVESAMAGMPGVTEVQSLSMFGLSAVSVYFADGVDIHFARQLVLERLQAAKEQIPEGVGEPELAPIATALGQVFEYILEGPGMTPMELRTIQDSLVRRSLRTVPGVADVVSFGGPVKQFQVRVVPAKLLQYGVTLAELTGAIERNNRNVGGGFIVQHAEEYLVRGLGLVGGLDAICRIVVKTVEGTPIYVRDLAEVAVGREVPRGTVLQGGRGEVVAGIVLSRIGENTVAVLSRVKARIAELERSLPAGVRIVPFYDRSELVARAVATVRDALLEGGVLIVLVLFLFLGNARSALVVTSTLPLSLLFSFLLMGYFGMSANLMSLGGLAIGLGMMVDGGVVMVENIFRHLAREARPTESTRDQVTHAALEVGRPIAFSVAIIIVVFLPLLTLEQVEGKLFRPMAFAISFALLGSLLVSLTAIPVFASLLLARGAHRETWILRKLKPRYLALLDRVTRHRRRTLGTAVVLLAGSLALFPLLGTEFVPSLEEGALLLRLTFAPSASLDEAMRGAGSVQEMVVREFGGREVRGVVTMIGRAEAGGEPEAVNNVEMQIELAPERTWRYASKAELVGAMEGLVSRYPGVQSSFSQPIQARVDELLSGVRAELAIKLFGDDLETLLDKAGEIAAAIERVDGAADVQVEQVSGQPQLQIAVDRDAIARYGINAEDVLEIVEVAVGGRAIGQVFDGPRRFDIFVRAEESARSDIPAISSLLVPAPGGAQIPLSELASLRAVVGPARIGHENAERRIVVQANVRGRDLGGFVDAAQRAVRAEVALPSGYRLEWSGQFENQQRAMRRLSIIVPITIALIFLLLFFGLGSLRMAGLIILNVPFALIGGIVALWLSRQYLSVPASVGFIALFGVAVLNGVVLVSYMTELLEGGSTPAEAARKGAELRLRPVLMTALVASLGLVPLLFATGAGSDVQRPLATVVIGGLVSSTLLTLLLLPTLFVWIAEHAPAREP